MGTGGALELRPPLGHHVLAAFQFFKAASDFLFTFFGFRNGLLNVVLLLLNRRELPPQLLFPGQDLFVEACHVVEMASQRGVFGIQG